MSNSMDHRISRYITSCLNDITHKCNTVYECVDKDAESIPESAASTNGTLFHHVQAQCNGLLCPPYDQEKELACVVCTK